MEAATTTTEGATDGAATATQEEMAGTAVMVEMDETDEMGETDETGGGLETGTAEVLLEEEAAAMAVAVMAVAGTATGEGTEEGLNVMAAEAVSEEIVGVTVVAIVAVTDSVAIAMVEETGTVETGTAEIGTEAGSGTAIVLAGATVLAEIAGAAAASDHGRGARETGGRLNTEVGEEAEVEAEGMDDAITDKFSRT